LCYRVGSIISHRGILTAAHCLFKAEYAVVVMGTHDLAANYSDVHRVRVNRSDFILHPNFSYHDASLDIAIIRIREAIKFNDFIQPVEIPSKHLFEETFVGEISITTGHGQYCDANCGASSVLRFSKNRIMSNNECRQYSHLHTFPTETQICISTSEHGVGSSCRGDSGSGLTIQRNKVTILVGLSSFGNRKCEERQPAIFTRLTSELVKWVWKELSAALVVEEDNN
jgi:secreted trypsin-like serine protease